MTMKLNEFYSTIGGDYTEARARFQSDERIARFLKMFPGDAGQILKFRHTRDWLQTRATRDWKRLSKTTRFLPQRLHRYWTAA